MRPIKIDYYELLGATRDADEDRIRSGFETAAQEVDTNTGDSSAQEERLGQLAEAYSALVTPSSRLLFDRYGYRSRGNPRIQEAIREARNIAERSDGDATDAEERALVGGMPAYLMMQIGIIDAHTGEVLVYTDPIFAGDPTTAVDRLRSALEKGFKKFPAMSQ